MNTTNPIPETANLKEAWPGQGDAPLLGIPSALLLGLGAFAILFSLST